MDQSTPCRVPSTLGEMDLRGVVSLAKPGSEPATLPFLSGLNVLFGPNGSGKTTALRAIATTLVGEDPARSGATERTALCARLYPYTGTTNPFIGHLEAWGGAIRELAELSHNNLHILLEALGELGASDVRTAVAAIESAIEHHDAAPPDDAEGQAQESDGPLTLLRNGSGLYPPLALQLIEVGPDEGMDVALIPRGGSWDVHLGLPLPTPDRDRHPALWICNLLWLQFTRAKLHLGLLLIVERIGDLEDDLAGAVEAIDRVMQGAGTDTVAVAEEIRQVEEDPVPTPGVWTPDEEWFGEYPEDFQERVGVCVAWVRQNPERLYRLIPDDVPQDRVPEVAALLIHDGYLSETLALIGANHQASDRLGTGTGEWARLPGPRIGTIKGIPVIQEALLGAPLHLAAEVDLASIHAEILDRVRGEARLLIRTNDAQEHFLEPEVVLTDDVAEACAKLSFESSLYFQKLLGDVFGELVIELDAEAVAAVDPNVVKVEFRTPNGDRAGLDKHGRGVRDIAELATRIALRHPRLIIADEVDSRLHAGLRSRLSRGLADVAAEDDLTIIVASHSAELLDEPSAVLWRMDDFSMQRVPTDFWQKRGAIGDLRPSDALMLTRAWLIVEGEHDKAVLNGWIGDALARRRVRIAKMGGTHQIGSVIDSQFLFEQTAARVVIAVDHSRAKVIKHLNQLLKDESLSSAPEKLHARLMRVLPDRGTKEEESLRELVRAAIQAGQQNRITLYGLSKPDIIHYLNHEHLGLEKKEDWATLDRQWKARPDSTYKGGDLTFKDWLKEAKNVRITTRSLERVVSQEDSIPPEITSLLDDLD